MKKRIPIFRTILFPLMMVVIVVIAILVSTLFGQGIVSQLNKNERDVIRGKISTRKAYVESIMVNDWMNLDDTVESMKALTEMLIRMNLISLDTLDDSSNACEPLLTRAAPYLIEMMRANQVTGAYLILNTEDLDRTAKSNVTVKPGIYIRDADPTSVASTANDDLLALVSPMSLTGDLQIGTDSTWDVCFRFTGDREIYYDFLYYPYQTAYEHDGRYTWRDMGYWGMKRSTEPNGESLLSYSVPITLDNGTIIGVLGVDLTFEYLNKILPERELSSESHGAYFIAQYSEAEDKFMNFFSTGNMEGADMISADEFRIDLRKNYLYMEPLHIYNNNAPFSDNDWVIAGTLSNKYMAEYARKLVVSAIIAIAVSLCIGVLTSLFASYRFKRPIAALVEEIHQNDLGKRLKLTPTGILEIDKMSDAVMELSRDLLESGRKFSKIIEMSSSQITGFQIDKENNKLFLTENFFSIFGDDTPNATSMTIGEFTEKMDSYNDYLVEGMADEDGYVFHMPIRGKQRYISVKVAESDGYSYGLAEDVTQIVLEKQILQHERDHDPLTNLYNRRAFRRELASVLAMGEEKLGVAALVMIDLDNLKYTNDTYGHEYGDLYIIKAAEAIERVLTSKAIYARISGDEFNAFIYGCNNREEVEACIHKLEKAVNSGAIELPDGKQQFVHASGGVAWYPDDSRLIDDLSKYADHAMYVAKRSHQRVFQYFDVSMVQNQEVQFRNSAALTRMLEDKLVHYAFQPIVDVKTGKPFAYEALMRPEVAPYFTIKEVMETARREGKLRQIEELTMFMALEAFDDHVKNGIIPPGTYLFVNSIPNQRLSSETEAAMDAKYGQFLHLLVLELTEDDQMDLEIWAHKQERQRKFNAKVALDDYGTGYNSEKKLLNLSPDFIKVDMMIVRDIHLNPDKRTIMEYIVNYAHERGKKIIAEGVETAEEVDMLIKLGADYVQGYFFAKPRQRPGEISDEGMKALARARRKYK